MERRLRADRRARRQGRRSRRLGHARPTAAARRSATRSCSSSPAISIASARCFEQRDATRPSERAARGRGRAMAQESFSDYHLYTLGRKTTINNNETKQVSMLNGTGVPVRKRYVVDGQAFYYRNAPASRARRSRTSCRSTTSSRTRSAAGLGHADAGGRRPRLSGRLEGRHAVRRRGSHRPHAEGRGR